MEYKVITEDAPNEVWGMGFYNDQGRDWAQKKVDEGYFHRYMYEKDKHKKLIVVPVKG